MKMFFARHCRNFNLIAGGLGTFTGTFISTECHVNDFIAAMWFAAVFALITWLLKRWGTKVVDADLDAKIAKWKSYQRAENAAWTSACKNITEDITP